MAHIYKSLSYETIPCAMTFHDKIINHILPKYIDGFGRWHFVHIIILVSLKILLVDVYGIVLSNAVFHDPCKLLDCEHVCFILLHFLPIPHHLLYFLWVDIFGPASFCMVDTSTVCLIPLCIHLK